MKDIKLGIKDVLAFARKSRMKIILGFIILLVVTVIASLLFNRTFSSCWGTLEPIISIFTLLLAGLISIIELIQEAEEKMPKRLTAMFEFENQLVMICHQAYLAGENDIRAWGQQLGMQMSKKEPLDFRPDIQQDSEIIRVKGQKVKHYRVRFTLTTKPKILTTLEASGKGYPLVELGPFD